jgi:uncharacterized protein YhdP
VRLADGRWRIGGMQIQAPDDGGGMTAWLLAQPQVRLRSAVIDIADAGQAARALRLEPADVTLQRRGGRHWLDLRVGMGGSASGAFRLLAEMTGLDGDIATSAGRAYVTARDLTGADVPFGGVLFAGQLDAEAWLRWKGGRVERVHGRIEGGGQLRRAGQTRQLSLDALHLAGIWQRTPEGWLAGLDSLRAESGDHVWRLDRSFMQRRADRLALSAGLIDVAGFGPVAGMLAAPDNALGAMLASADPTLRARDVQLTIERVAAPRRSIRLAGQVDELSWLPSGSLPGLAGAAGELRLTQSAASFTLAGAPHLSLDAPRAYVEPVQLDAARGTLTAQWSDAGALAQLDDFSARRGSIDLAVRGRLWLPVDGEPDVYIQAGTPQAPAALISAQRAQSQTGWSLRMCGRPTSAL